jgi:hypothetical protein
VKDPYSILGVSKKASDEEIKAAYKALIRKYHPDNYGDDNPLKDLANEKTQEINQAYDEIMRMRANAKNEESSAGTEGSSYSSEGVYANIRRTVNSRKFSEAEKQLLAIPQAERTAEWHYLASVLLMHRNRQNDAMRELEIACDLDPSNIEYQRAKEMFNNTANNYGNTYYGSVNSQQYQQRQSNYDACNCCADLICLDCICEICGGDFISCI